MRKKQEKLEKEIGVSSLCSVMRKYDKTKGVKGVGINDVPHRINIGKKLLPAYSAWLNMLRRCYDARHTSKYPTYLGCSVCEEWLMFSNFEKWYNENHRDSYDLDKDIIKRGNKVYCPEYCAYVPKQINYLLGKNLWKRGAFPIGVSYKRDKGKFKAYMLVNRRQVHLGYYDTPDEAFNAYKTAKESHIKEMAEHFFQNGDIDKRVFDALMRYEVNIYD